MTHPARPRQRGAAALIVTLMLFFAMALTALFVNRNLVFEQRSAANQYRATQAFEAAEAGLEWALAQLNGNDRLGSDCRPATGAGAVSFRERYLQLDSASGVRSGRTWNNAGTATALQPTCVRSGDGWACDCPSVGHPALSVSSSSEPLPAFSVAFQPGDRPGLVRLIATGCSSLGGACLPGSSTTTDATARNEVQLGLLSALVAPPPAPLTVRGAVEAGTATLGLHNADAASGGLLVRAGGDIHAAQARRTVPAGSTLADALADHDAALAALDGEALFKAHFGQPKAAWKAQPAVRRLACEADCGETLRRSIDTTGAPLLWIDGDLPLRGPLTLGSRERPAVIVAEGAVRIEGAVVIHGLVYGASLSWNGIDGAGALLRGAAIVEGGYAGNGAPDLYFDAALLALLKGQSGSFARVPGSWRDFQ